jgi:hypothetical protein
MEADRTGIPPVDPEFVASAKLKSTVLIDGSDSD